MIRNTGQGQDSPKVEPGEEESEMGNGTKTNKKKKRRRTMEPYEMLKFDSPEEFANFLEEEFPTDSYEQLDEDFVYFMNKLYEYIELKGITAKNQELVDSWVAKLTGEKVSGKDEIRNRNMYMSHLVLQVAGGDLSGPLAKQPPKGPLPYAGIEFELGKAPKKKKARDMQDIMFQPEDFVHLSKDGRTYLATKGLPGGSGACAYLAVSIGGGDPLWLDPCGKDVDMTGSVEFPVTHVKDSRGHQIFKTVGSSQCRPMERKLKAERESLKNFYLSILKRIIDMQYASADPCNPRGISDPVILRLLDKIRCKIEAEGPVPGECSTENLLSALKKKIICLYKNAFDREEKIDELRRSIGDDELHLVDLSSKIAFQPQDSIWLAALRETPSSATVELLRKQYPNCMVDAFLFFLERKRQVIIDQEKALHERIVGSMKTELLREVEEGVRNYKNARNEWTRVLSVLTNLEMAKKVMSKTTQVMGGPCFEEALAKCLPSNESDHANAKEKLAKARNLKEDIDAKLEEFSRRLADLKNKKYEADDLLRKETIRWSAIVNELEAELAVKKINARTTQSDSTRKKNKSRRAPPLHDCRSYNP